tara:strand:+ start:3066 stop:3446 length:381 start_codon:yes stop_codon:yes gene_type:complete
MLSTTGSVRIVTEIEVKMITADLQVTEFVVVSNRFDKKAEDNKGSDFVAVKIWGKRGVAVAEHFKKGDGIVITGSLQVEQWEKDGQKQRKPVIVVNDWEFPLSKKSGEGNNATQPKEHSAGGGAPF